MLVRIWESSAAAASGRFEVEGARAAGLCSLVEIHESPPTTPTPRRRWLQFSLRTLLVLVFGCGRGWLAYEIKRAGQLNGAASRLPDLSAADSRAQTCGN